MPKLPGELKTKRVLIAIEPTLKDNLTKIAGIDQCTFSSLVRRILSEWFHLNHERYFDRINDAKN